MKHQSGSLEDQSKITDYALVNCTKVELEEVVEDIEQKTGLDVEYELIAVYFFEFVFFENDAAADLLLKNMYSTLLHPFF